jgi:hypothetical protein
MALEAGWNTGTVGHLNALQKRPVSLQDNVTSRSLGEREWLHYCSSSSEHIFRRSWGNIKIYLRTLGAKVALPNI